MQSLTWEQRKEIERVCDRFEAELKAGRCPNLEAFAEVTEVAVRAPLLYELLKLEIDYRLAKGQSPRGEEYSGRVPDELIAKVLDLNLGETTVGELGSSESPPETARKMAATRFRSRRFHARGGLGQVFVAWDHELNREVALKEIQEQHLVHPERCERFQREAEITGRLEHPGIVPVYGLGKYPDGRPYYAMRFVRGLSLREAIEQLYDPKEEEPPFQMRPLIARFQDVCQTIGYAHSRGVLHRDLKPANIMLGKHGETLVVDWGLAKPLDEPVVDTQVSELPITPAGTSGSSETLPGSALGTPSFMSPEQAAGDLSRLGRWSDVYSLGATLYCILTGSAPVQGTNTSEILRRVKSGEFELPRTLNPQVSRSLESICLKAMCREPAQRYATCDQLAADIEAWMAGEPVTAHHERWGERVNRWARNHRSMVTGAAAILMTSVIALSTVAVLLGKANRSVRNAFLRAERETKTAIKAQQDADGQRLKAEQRRDRINALLYASDMNVAQLAWSKGNTEQAMALLKRHVPVSGEPDVRGFEWHNLWRLCHSSQKVLLADKPLTWIEFSPSRETVAAVTRDGNLILWDRRKAAQLHSVQTEQEDIQKIRFSPNGELVATIPLSGDMKIWRTEDMKLAHRASVAKGHSYSFDDMAFSHDLERMATIKGLTLALWELGDAKEVRRIVKPAFDTFSQLAFSESDSLIYTLTRDGEINVFDVKTGATVRRLRGRSKGAVLRIGGRRISGFATPTRVVPKGPLVAQAFVDFISQPENLTFREIENFLGPPVSEGEADKQKIPTIQLNVEQPVESLELSRLQTGEEMLVIALPDGEPKFLPSIRIQPGAQGDVRGQGTYLVDEVAQSTNAFPSKAQLTHLDSYQIVNQGSWELVDVSLSDSYRAWDCGMPGRVSFLDDNQVGVFSRFGGSVWDARFGTRKEVVGKPSAGRIDWLSRLVSEDGSVIVRVSNGVLTDDSRAIPLDLRGASVAKAFVSNNAEWVAVTKATRQKRTEKNTSWEEDRPVASFTLVRQMDKDQQLEISSVGQDAEVVAVRFDEELRRLAAIVKASGNRFSLQLLDLSGEPALTMSEVCRLEPSLCLVFHPDSKSIVVGGHDGQLVVIDLETGEETRRLFGHSDMVFDLNVSPDSQRIASAGFDGAICIWDPFEAALVTRIELDAPPLTIDFDNTGHRLAALTFDNKLHLWDARPLTPDLEPELEAARLVRGLFAIPLNKIGAINEIETNKLVSEDVRDKALYFAASYEEQSSPFIKRTWQIASFDNLESAIYEHALELATEATRIEPENRLAHAAVGLAQYRLGRYEQAKRSMDKLGLRKTPSSRANLLHNTPEQFAVQALVEHALNHKDESGYCFSRALNLEKSQPRSKNPIRRRILNEMESVIQ